MQCAIQTSDTAIQRKALAYATLATIDRRYRAQGSIGSAIELFRSRFDRKPLQSAQTREARKAFQRDQSVRGAVEASDLDLHRDPVRLGRIAESILDQTLINLASADRIRDAWIDPLAEASSDALASEDCEIKPLALALGYSGLGYLTQGALLADSIGNVKARLDRAGECAESAIDRALDVGAYDDSGTFQVSSAVQECLDAIGNARAYLAKLDREASAHDPSWTIDQAIDQAIKCRDKVAHDRLCAWQRIGKATQALRAQIAKASEASAHNPPRLHTIRKCDRAIGIIREAIDRDRYGLHAIGKTATVPAEPTGGTFPVNMLASARDNGTIAQSSHASDCKVATDLESRAGLLALQALQGNDRDQAYREAKRAMELASRARSDRAHDRNVVQETDQGPIVRNVGRECAPITWIRRQRSASEAR